MFRQALSDHLDISVCQLKATAPKLKPGLLKGNNKLAGLPYYALKGLDGEAVRKEAG